MTLSAALHATLGTLRRRPADLLPFYMVGAAVPAIARVVAFFGLGIAFAYLETTGRLETVRSDLSGRDLNPPDPGADPEAFAEWGERLAPHFEPLFPPTVVGLLGLTVTLTVLVAVALAAGAAAGQFAACNARLRGDRGLTAGVDGTRRHWLSFLWAYVAEGAIWIGTTAVTVLVVAGSAAAAPIVGLLVAPVAVLLWLAVTIGTRAVFAFVPVAIVVEGGGLRPAVRSTTRFLRRNPVEAIGYYAIAVGTLLAFSTVIVILSVVNVQAVAAPIAYLALAPALDLVKVALYEADHGQLSPPIEPVAAVGKQLSAGVLRGLGEVVGFVRATPVLHVASIVVFVGGAVMGWAGASPFLGSLETSIVARLADHVPPVAAIQFFGNNWTVAFSLAFSGVGLAVPAAVALWFNGLVIGAFARLEADPEILAAFLLPHGVAEIPSLLIAGALGFHLGLVTWRTWRGRASRSDLADALERGFWVVVGLGVLLAVAALLEGFVSPYYWRPFL